MERQFQIIGETITRLNRDDPSTLSRIREYEQIVSFRNWLVHGYDKVEQYLVWDAIVVDLPLLLQDVESLMTEGED